MKPLLTLEEQRLQAAEASDVVIAAEVIEHLENPRQVAREWFQILKTGSTLILSTPKNDSTQSLMALLLREHCVAFLDSCCPAHVTALLRKDLVRILTECQVFRPTLPLHQYGSLPKLSAVSWQQVSLGLLKSCRFSAT
jgi:2-polyprenyl-3-methyl-5-hydroxy-6-metoxy-1,4-benzoquinol methylase